MPREWKKLLAMGKTLMADSNHANYWGVSSRILKHMNYVV